MHTTHPKPVSLNLRGLAPDISIISNFNFTYSFLPPPLHQKSIDFYLPSAWHIVYPQFMFVVVEKIAGQKPMIQTTGND